MLFTALSTEPASFFPSFLILLAATTSFLNYEPRTNCTTEMKRLRTMTRSVILLSFILQMFQTILFYALPCHQNRKKIPVEPMKVLLIVLQHRATSRRQTSKLLL